MVTEQTQFSMTEFKTFCAEPRPETLSKRQASMAAFQNLNVDFAPYGGADNIQRVRVLSDSSKPGVLTFDYVTKLPPEMAFEKARQAEREAAVAKFRALLETDPKAAVEYVRTVAYKVLDRAVTILLLEAAKPAKKSKPAAKPQRKPLPKAKGSYSISRKSMSDFEKAYEQDRRNRIEAAKLAAKQFHENHKKAS